MPFSRTHAIAIAATAGLFGLAACAQQGGDSRPPASLGGAPSQGMQGMSMDQMMAHCREMQGMDHAQMGPDMQQMMQQCDAMMRAHGGASTPGGRPSAMP